MAISKNINDIMQCFAIIIYVLFICQYKVMIMLNKYHNFSTMQAQLFLS